MATVSILGGYGNFGRRLCEELSHSASVRVVGHESALGRAWASRYDAAFRPCDIREPKTLREAIAGSDLVVDAAGPFQKRDYGVARACIDLGIHCIDLADARSFVAGIDALDEAAARRGVMVVSGASSVPGITALMLDRLVGEFGRISDITAAITSGNQNPRGAATLAAGLSSVGRPFEITMNAQPRRVHGWAERRILDFPPPVGRRAVHLCEVPDVELFPSRYQASTVRFYAGVELDFFHRLLSLIGWLRRRVLDLDLSRWGHFMQWTSGLFARLGTPCGSLGVWVRGTDREGRPLQRRLAFVTDADGPATPCSLPVLLAERVLSHGPPRVGAFPCLDLIGFDTLAAWLARRRVWPVFGDAYEWRTAPLDRKEQPGAPNTSP